MLALHSGSLADTHAIAAALASLARRGDVIVLAGSMGAGKTAFVQGFGAALGVDEPITSPTFTLVHSYDTGRLPLHHADVYRLTTLHEFSDLALGELGGIVVIEWGDAVASALGDHLVVELTAADSDDERHVQISAHGPEWATRWSALCSAMEPWSC